jgi:hypothetical protein
VSVWGIVLTFVSGVAINECSDAAPWLANRLVRWSAFRRHADAERAADRAEELAALIQERPGKICKLLTATAFLVDALIHRDARQPTRWWPALGRVATHFVTMLSAMAIAGLAAGFEVAAVDVVTGYSSTWLDGITIFIVVAPATGIAVLVRQRVVAHLAAGLMTMIPFLLFADAPWRFVLLMAAGTALASAMIGALWTHAGFAITAGAALLLGAGCSVGYLVQSQAIADGTWTNTSGMSPLVVTVGSLIGLALGFAVGLGLTIGRVLFVRLARPVSSARKGGDGSGHPAGSMLLGPAIEPGSSSAL